MTGASGIVTLLTHENQECVIDLIRKLHSLDPASLMLLYKRGQDSQLPALAWHAPEKGDMSC